MIIMQLVLELKFKIYKIMKKNPGRGIRMNGKSLKNSLNSGKKQGLVI